MGWHLPLDPDCPVVWRFRHQMAMDPMNYSIPSDVLRDVEEHWASQHRPTCPRCQAFGLASVDVE